MDPSHAGEEGALNVSSPLVSAQALVYETSLIPTVHNNVAELEKLATEGIPIANVAVLGISFKQR